MFLIYENMIKNNEFKRAERLASQGKDNI